MKRIIIYILCIFSIVLIGCSEEQKESFYTKGFEVNEVKINNEKESIDISFKYYKSLDIDEFNQELNENVLKVGLIIKYSNVFDIEELVIGGSNQYEIEVDLNNDNLYSLSFNDNLENNYKKPITIRLYYKYEYKNEIKYRYSDEFYSKSIYDLAKEESGSLSDKIIDAFKEEISLVAFNLDYEKYLVSSLETNYSVKIIEPLDYEVIKVLVIVSDEVKLKKDFVLKVNGLVINQEDYSVSGNEIVVSLADNKVKEVDISIDFNEKTVSINNQNFILNYNVYDNNYNIKLTLKDEFLFHPEFILKSNGKELSETDYILSDKTITFNYLDNFVREIKINLDTTNYVVSSSSTQCSVLIKKPLDYIYINTIITLNEGLVLSENFKLIVNDIEINKEKYSIDDQNGLVVITYQIDDPNWTKPY